MDIRVQDWGGLKSDPRERHGSAIGFVFIGLFFAKLSPAQSNSNSVGWADIALISTPPPGKVPRRQFQYGYRQNLEGRFVGPSLTDD